VKRLLLFALALMVAGGLLAAAGGAPPAPAVAMLQATETPTGEPEATPPGDSASMDEMPTALPSTLPDPDQYCIDCHTDAEQLQLLAEEEEVVESLSEGSG